MAKAKEKIDRYGGKPMNKYGEPWEKTGCYGHLFADKSKMDEPGAAAVIGEIWPDMGLRDREKYSTRVCLCVNACVGIPQEALEKGIVKEMLDMLRIELRNHERNGLYNYEWNKLAKSIIEKATGQKWGDLNNG
jgi:hypothetical protein